MCTDKAREILSDLLSANASYIAGESKSQAELSPPSLRENLATNGQTPVAAIVACADSRVAPEIIFAAGLGKVFVIRNAGNAAWDDSVVGSLEYAVAHLGVPLVIVLGHSMCGAIGAAVSAAKNGEAGAADTSLGKHVERLADVIKSEIEHEDAVKACVEKNVAYGVKSLLEGNSQVASMAKQGEIAVVGAVYDLHTGQVKEIVNSGDVKEVVHQGDIQDVMKTAEAQEVM